MARSWLEVTTDEVQPKLGAGKRLAERRDAIAERAGAIVEETMAPAFKRAAEQVTESIARIRTPNGR